MSPFSRVKTRCSSMPSSAAAVAIGMYQLSEIAAGSWLSRMSRMRPPPSPTITPMSATPSRSMRRSVRRRREHGALDGADRDGGEVEPEGDDEERGCHGTK